MGSPSWENLDDFLDPADFAGPVVLHPQNGQDRTINGIFDAPFLNAQLGEYEPETSQPRVTAKASDLVGITRGDMATVDGEVYDVMAVEPDGTGMAVLRLAPRG